MTLFVSLAVALAAAAAPGPEGAPAMSVDGSCAAASGPEIRVNVTGLKDRTGRLKLELYPATPDDFLKDDHDLLRQGKVFRRVWFPMPTAGPVNLCIRAPVAGRFALLLTHDRDGKNKFNFWKDGAGFVGKQRIGYARPKVDQAVLDVGANGTSVTVRTQYMHTFGGFGPVGN